LRIMLENLKKSYGKKQVLKGIDLEIKDREMFCVLGPSGSGKTTLLRLVAGLDKPDEGRIFFGDDEVTELSAKERNVSMVFQNLALFPTLTAFENIAFPLRVRRVPENEVRKKVREVAELLRVDHVIERKITSLSGGERQRVALARALIYEPRAFLLDEPLTALEPQLRAELREEIKRIQRITGITTVYVTHDQIEAMVLADRIALLNDGFVRDVGEPMRVYSRPANLWVASFLYDIKLNIFNGRVEAGKLVVDELGLVSKAPEGIKEGKRLKIVLRPEDIRLGESGERIVSGTVRDVKLLGDRVVYEVEVGEKSIIVKEFKPSKIPKINEEVKMSFDDKCFLFFDEEGKAV